SLIYHRFSKKKPGREGRAGDRRNMAGGGLGLGLASGCESLAELGAESRHAIELRLNGITDNRFLLRRKPRVERKPRIPSGPAGSDVLRLNVVGERSERGKIGRWLRELRLSSR